MSSPPSLTAGLPPAEQLAQLEHFREIVPLTVTFTNSTVAGGLWVHAALQQCHLHILSIYNVRLGLAHNLTSRDRKVLEAQVDSVNLYFLYQQ